MAPTVSSRMTPSTVCILTELTLIYEGFENAIHRTGMDGWVCAHSCELLLAHTNGESPERFWCDVFSLFFNAVFTIWMLFLLNRLLRRFTPKLDFDNRELLTIYIMVNMVSSLCSYTAQLTVIPNAITYPFWGRLQKMTGANCSTKISLNGLLLKNPPL